MRGVVVLAGRVLSNGAVWGEDMVLSCLEYQEPHAALALPLSLRPQSTIANASFASSVSFTACRACGSLWPVCAGTACCAVAGRS